MVTSKCWLLILLYCVLLLTGCEEKITKDEVIDEANAIKIHSFEAKSRVNSTVKEDGTTTTRIVDEQFTYIDSPYIFHYLVTGDEDQFELYIDPDTTYLMNPDLGHWEIVPQNMIYFTKKLTEGKMLRDELRRLKRNSELYEFAEKNGKFVLTVIDDANDDVKRLAKKALIETLPVKKKDLTINKYTYELQLDRDFLVSAINVKIDFEVEEDGEVRRIVNSEKYMIKNVNKVEKFTVPKDIANNAIKNINAY